MDYARERFIARMSRTISLLVSDSWEEHPVLDLYPISARMKGLQVTVKVTPKSAHRSLSESAPIRLKYGRAILAG